MGHECRTCEFFAVTEPGKGQCREGAPQLVVIPAPATALVGGQTPPPIMLGTWPPTAPRQWCGKWRERADAGEQRATGVVVEIQRGNA